MADFSFAHVSSSKFVGNVGLALLRQKEKTNMKYVSNLFQYVFCGKMNLAL